MSRLNALKHGILAEQVVLPSEDPAEFAAFENALYEQLKPVGELEWLQAGLIATHAWRLRRAMLVEKGIFMRGIYGLIAENENRKAEGYVSHPDSLMTRLAKSINEEDGEPTIEDPDAHRTALARAREAEKVRDSNDALLGAAFIRDAGSTDALSKLSRYEAHIQRSLFKSLDELSRLQGLRQGLGSESEMPGHVADPPELD